MIKLTKNFSLEELSSTNKARYQKKNLEIAKRKHQVNLTLLAHLFLQPLRDIVKRPVIVTSAYRYYWLNRAVGGSKNSQHRYAEAVDFVVRDHGPEDLEKVFLNIKDGRSFDTTLVSQCILETRSGKKGNWQWIHLGMMTDRFRKFKKYQFKGPQFLWTVNGRDYAIWE